MYKIEQAIGYVFEKRKLIITIPVGYSCGSKEMIEKDLSFKNHLAAERKILLFFLTLFSRSFFFNH